MANHNFKYRHCKINIDVPEKIGTLVALRDINPEMIKKMPNILNVWLIIGLTIGAILALILLFYVFITLQVNEDIASVILMLSSLMIVIAPFGIYILIERRFASRFEHIRLCAVGTEGIAIYDELKMDRKVFLTKMLLFKNLDNLVFSREIPKTETAVNPENTKNTKDVCRYNFRFYYKTQIVYENTGQITSEKTSDNLTVFSANRFLYDIEAGWTHFLLPRLTQKIKTEGFAAFGEKLEVGIDYIKYKDRKQIIINKLDIKNMYCRNGFLYIEHNNYEEESGTSKDDCMVIKVYDMPNAVALLALLSRLYPNFITEVYVAYTPDFLHATPDIRYNPNEKQ